MRSFSLPLPTLFAGFVAVLVGYASSAAIIWQAAAAAGATPGQIAGWMTALGLAMGISTLALSAWRKVPVLTAWSTPGAALLVSGLQGVTLAEAVGIFIFANALIVICGATGLFARLMQIIPHSLAAAMLAGILLRFGLQAFAGLQDHLPLCGGMLAAWLLCKALCPRFAVVAALVIGALIAAASGDVASAAVPLAFVTPEWVAPQFTPALLLSVGLPFFLVTMASQKRSGVRHPAGIRLYRTGLRTDRRLRGVGTTAGAVWGLFRLHRGDHRRHMPEPGGAPGSEPALAGGHSRGRFLSAGRSVRRVNHRPDVGPAAGVDPDAGGSGAARHHRRESVSGSASGQ